MVERLQFTFPGLSTAGRSTVNTLIVVRIHIGKPIQENSLVVERSTLNRDTEVRFLNLLPFKIVFVLLRAPNRSNIVRFEITLDRIKDLLYNSGVVRKQEFNSPSLAH